MEYSFDIWTYNDYFGTWGTEGRVIFLALMLTALFGLK